MKVFKLKMNQGLLDCSYCHLPLRPPMIATFTCLGGHIFCGDCMLVHGKACHAPRSMVFRCNLLDDIVTGIKVKCDCDRYIPYWKYFLQHHCPSVKSSAPPARRKKCIVKKTHLLCSDCQLPLRPPIFKHLSRELQVCSGCYHRGDIIATYRHCTELDYLVQGMTVKCVACKQSLPFSTLTSHQLDDCPFKHTLQKMAPSSAPKNICGSDEEETKRARNNIIHGKNKRKAPFQVGKMDKHIVHSDEVGNDDDSSDDIPDMSEDEFSCEDDSIDGIDEEETPKKPETGKKAKVATPSVHNGQKTGNPEGKAKEPNDQMKIGAKALKSKAGNNEDRDDSDSIFVKDNEHRVSEQDSNECEEIPNIKCQSRAMLQRRSGKKRAADGKVSCRKSVRLATQHGVK